MEIIHVAAECYPVAKAGGLGDVVGSLPKYQQTLGKRSMGMMMIRNDSSHSRSQFATGSANGSIHRM
jgi:starch synthase